MCPLIDAPNRGFADYQRQGPYDSGVLYTETVSPLVFTQTGVIDVSRYAYLGGIDGISGGDAYVTFMWYADKTGLIVTGERRLTLTGNIGKGMMQYRLVNLGPFVQVSWNRIGGAVIDHQTEIFGTNRYHPIEFIPVDSTIAAPQNVPIGNSVTDTYYPPTYYAGPMNVWFFASGGAPWFVNLQALSTGGAWNNIDQLGSLGAGGTRAVFIAPPGAWAFKVSNNTGAASSYYLGVTPSLTGAT